LVSYISGLINSTTTGFKGLLPNATNNKIVHRSRKQEMYTNKNLSYV
jgi:hypothetical protein